MSGAQTNQNLIPDPRSPNPNPQILALSLLLLLYLVVALAHACLAPLTTGPDELAHYEYVRFIAEYGRLPLDNTEREQASYKSDQPPLYHLLAALPASLVDPTGPPFLKRVGDHPRRQLIERTRHFWGLYNTEDERWPYRAEVLRWHVGRWVAILFGAATVAVTFFIARDLFTHLPLRTGVEASAGDREGAGVEASAGDSGQTPVEISPPILSNQPSWLPALGAAAVVAFIPRFVLTGSMLNYETALAFFAALFLWVLLRMASGGIGEWRMANERTHRARVANGESANGEYPTGHRWANDESVNLYPKSGHRQGKGGESLRNTQSCPERSRRDAPRTTHHALLLGLFTGLAITTKLSAMILPLEVVIALWLIGRHQGWSWTTWGRTVSITVVAALVAVSWWFGFIVYQFNTVVRDGWWVGLLRPLIAADASDATTNRLLSFLTSGQAGFTGAIENLDSGPPWQWLAIFFRTFWVVGIEKHQPLGFLGLLVALFLCLLAAYGLFIVWRRTAPQRAIPFDDHHQSEDPHHAAHPATSTPPQARRQGQASEQHATRNTQYAVRNPRLLLSLLLLHLATPFILPLLRYAVTFSLADTAQGRHILFLAVPAFAILLVWGLGEAVWQVTGGRVAGSKVAGSQVAGGRVAGSKVTLNTQHATRNTQHATRLTFLLPPLFLLLWSIAQLWYMTWAYHPLLPVRTLPVAKAQASYQLNQALNEYVTLVGYNSQLDDHSQMLRLDLIWQATAISPVDYLTEVSLLDGQDNLQAQWVGYPAGGRYPTRAWDVGDIIRDTVWLPLVGLKPGQYRLNLNLIATTLNPPPESAPQQLNSPLPLTTITLQSLPQPPTPNPQSPTPNLQAWQNGQPLTTPSTFRYRETVLLTLDPPLSDDQPYTIQIIGPVPNSKLNIQNSKLTFAPVRELNHSVLFIVGPDWPGGDYQVQLTFTEAGQGDAPLLTSGPIFSVIDRWQRQFAPPSISYEVEANFANQVKLLGYDLSTNRAEPGGGIPVTLYWQGLDWLGYDYTIFTKLLAADQTVHGGRDRLPREGYRTLYWAPDEIITDPFGVPVDADAPDGIYYLNIGLYKQVGQQAVSLPLVQDGQPIEASSVNIGPLKIGRTPSDLVLETANPQVPLDQPFGDTPNLTLLGYDLVDQAGHPVQNLELNPQNLKLTLYWRSESRLPLDYTTFVHLRNEANEIVAQKDQPPLKGAYPTSLWDPGEIIADEIVIPLPVELPVGEYSLVVGLYDFNTGARLTVPGHPENSLLLGTMEINH